MEQESTLSISQELEEVRKAHRLIHSFQERMISIIKFIQTRLDFPEFYGYKQFSNPIKMFKQGNHKNYMQIYPEMWAWDFIYSYVFEYYFGEKTIKKKGDEASLSIIQYSDTGFFENDNDDRNAPSSFAPVEKSASKLLFILELKPKKVKTWMWDFDELCMTKKYASTKHTRSIEHSKSNKLLLYSIPLEKFTDEQTALVALREFAEFCCQEAGFEMDDFKLD